MPLATSFFLQQVYFLGINFKQTNGHLHFNQNVSIIAQKEAQKPFHLPAEVCHGKLFPTGNYF